MKFRLYNTLSRTKEDFVPYNPPFVGLYVCGPTVYGDPHLGHARPAVTYDLLLRLLRALGYKVRYVRNITDVGHLEHDADDGEDKLAKKARIEKLEPMEVAQYYTNRYRDAMKRLGVLSPSIEPQASGHIIEQIELIKQILDAGYAYESNGSVYFDVDRYDRDYRYGELSGRSTDEMLSATRQLDGQGDKRKSYDFALWKKAAPGHIMRWPSPWSEGFPGWHLECSAMSRKYLGERFDIHGGGMDLIFPHHECEIAQSTASMGHQAVRYWMHNNMITVDGKKMGKSLGNFITLDDLFSGDNKLERGFSPMTVRFFILQAHYRSTLDFSQEALSAAEKGFERLMNAMATLDKITPSAKSTVDVSGLKEECMEPLCDDLNSPVAIATLFEWVKVINQLHDGSQTITAADLKSLDEQFRFVVTDLLGLEPETERNEEELIGGLISMILDVRQQAKEAKNWAVSDKIRDELTRLGVTVKDRKDGADWQIK